IESLQFRDLPDSFLPDFFDSFDKVLALDWDRMIPGHPYAGGRLGTKDDVRAAKQYMVDLSDAVRQAQLAGKCFNTRMKEIKVPEYGTAGQYRAILRILGWRLLDRYLSCSFRRKGVCLSPNASRRQPQMVTKPCVFSFRTESGMPDHEIRKAFDLGGQLHYRYIGHRRGDLSQPAGDGEDHVAASDSEDCRYKERDAKHG